MLGLAAMPKTLARKLGSRYCGRFHFGKASAECAGSRRRQPQSPVVSTAGISSAAGFVVTRELVTRTTDATTIVLPAMM